MCNVTWPWSVLLLDFWMSFLVDFLDLVYLLTLLLICLLWFWTVCWAILIVICVWLLGVFLWFGGLWTLFWLSFCDSCGCLLVELGLYVVDLVGFCCLLLVVIVGLYYCWCFVCLFVGLRSVLVIVRWSRWVECVFYLACVCFDCLLSNYFWVDVFSYCLFSVYLCSALLDWFVIVWWCDIFGWFRLPFTGLAFDCWFLFELFVFLCCSALFWLFLLVGLFVWLLALFSCLFYASFLCFVDVLVLISFCCCGFAFWLFGWLLVWFVVYYDFRFVIVM